VKENEERFRTLCAASPIGIFEADARGSPVHEPHLELDLGADARGVEGLQAGSRSSIRRIATPR